MWTVDICIVFTGIRLLLLIHSFISSFFFLSKFQTLKCFVTLFSGTVRPRRLNLGTHVDSGQMYRVYQNQSAAAYTSFCFVFFSPIFKHEHFSSHFFPELWGLEDWNLLHKWKMGGSIVYTGIMLLLVFVPLFFIFLSLQFSNIKIFRRTFLRNCEA